MQRHRALKDPRGLSFMVLAWSAVGLVAGGGSWIASRLDGGSIGWSRALLPPMLAALWWVPITLAALWMAQRFPLRHRSAPRPAAPGSAGLSWRAGLVHAATAVSASFLLNLGWVGTGAALGWWEPSAVPSAAVAGGLRWLHVNAGVYLLLVGAATLWLRPRHDGADESGGPGRERLQVGGAGRTTLLDVADIDWIEGAGDYACIHALGREHLSSDRLKELEQILRPDRFVRIHRSSIVNVDRIRTLRHVSHGDYEAELECGAVLRVSRRRRRALQRVLQRRTIAVDDSSGRTAAASS